MILLNKAVYYTVIKHEGHLRTRGKWEFDIMLSTQITMSLSILIFLELP